MANEGSITLSLSIVNGNFIDNLNMATISFDQTAEGVDGAVVSVAITDTTLSFANLTNEGYVFFRNLDTTNYVLIGPDSTGLVDFIKLDAGQIALLPIKPGITVKAKFNTLAGNLFYRAWED